MSDLLEKHLAARRGSRALGHVRTTQVRRRVQFFLNCYWHCGQDYGVSPYLSIGQDDGELTAWAGLRVSWFLHDNLVRPHLHGKPSALLPPLGSHVFNTVQPASDSFLRANRGSQSDELSL